jgi:hypothetical protein
VTTWAEGVVERFEHPSFEIEISYRETFVCELSCGLFDFDFITEIPETFCGAGCSAFMVC